MNFNLALPLYRNSRAAPQRLALVAGGTALTYGELAALARRIAAWLPRGARGRVGRVGILASRSLEACAGALGTSWAGGTYVPLGHKLPEERLATVLALAELDAVITDGPGARLLSERVLAACPRQILVPDEALMPARRSDGGAPLSFAALAEPADEMAPVEVAAADIAYIEFTSGTTGVPKGVMVPAGAVRHYLDVIRERYRIRPEDRVAETAELSFDISVSNMFMTWEAGASLHVVPATQALAPAKFIQQHRLTVWYSVPSIIAILKQMRLLPPGAFPSLRYSLFLGEPLPVSAARAWQAAAPDSVVDNLYGPTEATVACLAQRVTDAPLVTAERDIVAIGTPFPGMSAAILDGQQRFLPPGQVGEIALAGPQLAAGYLGVAELTAARFPVIGGRRWYLTGDLGRQDVAGIFHHLGRIDNQVKVLGNRVELEEVEAHLQAVSRTELAAAVAWPVSHGSADGIVAFVAGAALEPAQIREALKKRLPPYMVPSAVHAIATMPMTASGKVDRKFLRARLAEGRQP
ncbi:MAG TPA: amino acid adenylation domain-containing protein [Alphaproteobacteria bacterium]|nr:amino acid adenylation domain-containing protein [Alphaproteobacteria bacterium]